MYIYRAFVYLVFNLFLANDWVFIWARCLCLPIQVADKNIAATNGNKTITVFKLCNLMLSLVIKRIENAEEIVTARAFEDV